MLFRSHTHTHTHTHPNNRILLGVPLCSLFFWINNVNNTIFEIFIFVYMQYEQLLLFYSHTHTHFCMTVLPRTTKEPQRSRPPRTYDETRNNSLFADRGQLFADRGQLFSGISLCALLSAVLDRKAIQGHKYTHTHIHTQYIYTYICHQVNNYMYFKNQILKH